MLVSPDFPSATMSPWLIVLSLRPFLQKAANPSARIDIPGKEGITFLNDPRGRYADGER